MNVHVPAARLTRDEILIALSALGENPTASRVDELRDRIDASTLPAGEREGVVRAVVDAARQQHEVTAATQEPPAAEPWPAGAVAKFHLASAPEARNAITYARRNAQNEYICTYDDEPINQAVWTLVEERESPQFEDEEVVGLDSNGCVMQWDGDKGQAYTSGESLQDWGMYNLREHEIVRVGVTPEAWTAAVSEYDGKLPNMRDLIGELLDYAERYADMNGEPQDGDCREAIGKAERWCEAGSATLDPIALATALVEYVERYADANDEPDGGDCRKLLASAASVARQPLEAGQQVTRAVVWTDWCETPFKAIKAAAEARGKPDDYERALGVLRESAEWEVFDADHFLDDLLQEIGGATNIVCQYGEAHGLAGRRFRAAYDDVPELAVARAEDGPSPGM